MFDSSYEAHNVYGYKVRWGKSSNMEAVTHTFLGRLMNSGVGAFKTLDAFDYSVEHLSLYERRLGLMSIQGDLRSRAVSAIAENLAERTRNIRKEAEIEWGSLLQNPSTFKTPINDMQRNRKVESSHRNAHEKDEGAEYNHDSVLNEHYPHLHFNHFHPDAFFQKSSSHAHLSPAAKERVCKTIVLMPFYGVGVGTGHSIVSTRFAYLNLTFWSHFRVFPHIGVVRC